MEEQRSWQLVVRLVDSLVVLLDTKVSTRSFALGGIGGIGGDLLGGAFYDILFGTDQGFLQNFQKTGFKKAFIKAGLATGGLRLWKIYVR